MGIKQQTWQARGEYVAGFLRITPTALGQMLDNAILTANRDIAGKPTAGVKTVAGKSKSSTAKARSTAASN